MSENKFIAGINKTGFGLEFSISKTLIADGWTVINNKYYIDDVQGSAREIDILAYKVSLKDEIQIYTVLIISCKKSIENSWALLAKSKNKNDPNIDWEPVTIWSNKKIIKLIIEEFEWKHKYVTSSEKLRNKLFSPENHIFAFQELNTKKGTPQNDKSIFSSIVSSMKSQDYEIGSLNKRKEQDSFYNFNLISVIDAPLIRINYGDGDPVVEEIDSDIYVGSYIINKKETISRVHFITCKDFASQLDIYNELHFHNIKQTSVIIDSYFANCMENELKIGLFVNDFNKKLMWDIYFALRKIRDDGTPNLSDIKIDIRWDNKKKCVALSIDGVWDDAELQSFNTNKKIRDKIASSLKSYYRYNGDFYFESNAQF